MASVFLSHSHADKPLARQLANDLRSMGHFVWIDEAEILVGDSLVEKIRAGLDDVDFVIAIISKDSVASEWVKKELDIAMNQEISGKTVRILPLLADDTPLPGFLLGKKYAQCGTETDYRNAIAELGKRLGPATPVASTPSERETLLRELEALRRQVHSHATREATLMHTLAKNRPESLRKAIFDDNAFNPDFTPINNLFAFEVMGQPITLGYLLHAARKSAYKGGHVLEMMLSLENKWDEANAMLEAARQQFGTPEK